MDVKEAINFRRSIRKFKKDEVSDKIIYELLDAARLAPSGCNAQPGRYRIVKDEETKRKICEYAKNQKFLAEAPVIIICCSSITGYLDGTLSGIQDLGELKAVDSHIVEHITNRVDKLRTMNLEELKKNISFNVAIAIEHIVLRAQEYGLGTCWVRIFDEKKIKDLFGWGEDINAVALIPVGYPDEKPAPRKRLSIDEILI
jgi:nitroreductase